MSRPLYETGAQRERETRIVAYLSDLWECRARKLPITYHLDYVFERDGQAVAFAELKSRTTKTWREVSNLGGYLINLSKIERARTVQATTGLTFVLVVEFADGIRSAVFRDLAAEQFQVVVRGRADRGDWQDVEPAVVIDAVRLEPVGIDLGALT